MCRGRVEAFKDHAARLKAEMPSTQKGGKTPPPVMPKITLEGAI